MHGSVSPVRQEHAGIYIVLLLSPGRSEGANAPGSVAALHEAPTTVDSHFELILLCSVP